MTAADRDEAARALERSRLAQYWCYRGEHGVPSLRDALALLVPGETSIERIAWLLVCARAARVDILAAVRIAQHRMDELQLEAAVPVAPIERKPDDRPHVLRILESDIPY